MIDDDIAAHYDLGLEGERLRVGEAPRLEYLRTLELLERFLAPASEVLDVGGGTGVYAVPLAAVGHRVRLVDPMPRHVAAAGAVGIDAVVGDARSLDEADASYDAVLLLGPLYHLTSHPDRLRALREAARVLRPGGVVLAAAISRHASLLGGITEAALDDPGFQQIVQQDLSDGQHRNPDPVGNPSYFTTAFFHLPAELGDELVDAGFVDTSVLAVEGPGWLLEDHGVPTEQLLWAARAAEGDAALLSVSAHLLAVGRRPA